MLSGIGASSGSLLLIGSIAIIQDFSRIDGTLRALDAGRPEASDGAQAADPDRCYFSAVPESALMDS